MRGHNPFRRIGELFDASALGIVTLLLLGASFYATWQGMSDFVTSKASGDQAGTTALVLLVVFTLTLAMYVALRETVNPIRKRNIIPAFILYAVLALWSVGFGYGFWWSLIAGEDATEAALTRTFDSFDQAGSEMRAEVVAAVALVETVEAFSEETAERERRVGGTCGVASPPGDGPLSRAREQSRTHIARVGQLAREGWLGGLDRDLEGLRSLEIGEPIEGEAPDARKRRLVELGRKANRWAGETSAKSALAAALTSERLADAASELSIPPGQGTDDSCYDPNLAATLRSVAVALDKSYDIESIPFQFAEGADGVALAVEDLWLGVFGRLGLVDQSAGKKLRTDGRSLIALMATIGVDLALFIFALLRGGMRRPYNKVLPPATPIAPVKPDTPADGGGEVQDVLEVDTKTALPAPIGGAGDSRAAAKPRQRMEADPKAVGIGSTDADSHSQIRDAEQVTDLIRSVDGHYRAMTEAEVIADRDEEIAALKAELHQLKQRGYLATGRAGQDFDPLLHKQVGAQASDQPKGKIIATVRPGYITDGQDIYRIAHVIVSSGPDDFEF